MFKKIKGEKIMNNSDMKHIETARECLEFRNISCDNKDCKNIQCPLNKFWIKKKKAKEVF
jgi:hypothetical protein